MRDERIIYHIYLYCIEKGKKMQKIEKDSIFHIMLRLYKMNHMKKILFLLPLVFLVSACTSDALPGKSVPKESRTIESPRQ